MAVDQASRRTVEQLESDFGLKLGDETADGRL